MITSFRHKGLLQFFETGSTAGVQANQAKRLRLQLVALDTAQVIEDMDIPGFRLHPLKGEMKGHWSISVNGNWRITFEFKDGNAHVLDYEDDHLGLTQNRPSGVQAPRRTKCTVFDALPCWNTFARSLS